jgi:peptidoglycan glycosyltransferase
MMRNNVLNQYGQSQFGDLAVCAKSGTAEVGGGSQPHAWFAGFIDDSSHPLAFIVLVENGGSGASVAGAVAAKVLAQATAN